MQGDNEALGQLYGVNDKIKKIQGECEIYRNQEEKRKFQTFKFQI